MGTNRSYNDMCGLAHALDLVGERWALLVVRELVLGPRRFTDLRAELPGISSNVLTHRLEELTTAGVVSSRTLPPPAGSAVYELTEWGAELEPIMLRLGRWGARSPTHPSGERLSANSLILSLRTNFDANAAADAHVSYELRMNREAFHVRVAAGTLSTQRAGNTAEPPDAIIEASPVVLAGLLYGGSTRAEATRTGALTIDGDHSAIDDFLSWFTLPEPAVLE